MLDYLPKENGCKSSSQNAVNAFGNSIAIKYLVMVFFSFPDFLSVCYSDGASAPRSTFAYLILRNFLPGVSHFIFSLRIYVERSCHRMKGSQDHKTFELKGTFESHSCHC